MVYLYILLVNDEKDIPKKSLYKYRSSSTPILNPISKQNKVKELKPNNKEYSRPSNPSTKKRNKLEPIKQSEYNEEQFDIKPEPSKDINKIKKLSPIKVPSRMSQKKINNNNSNSEEEEEEEENEESQQLKYIQYETIAISEPNNDNFILLKPSLSPLDNYYYDYDRNEKNKKTKHPISVPMFRAKTGEDKLLCKAYNIPYETKTKSKSKPKQKDKLENKYYPQYIESALEEKDDKPYPKEKKIIKLKRQPFY